jgi:hypothetical protein
MTSSLSAWELFGMHRTKLRHQYWRPAQRVPLDGKAEVLKSLEREESLKTIHGGDPEDCKETGLDPLKS